MENIEMRNLIDFLNHHSELYDKGTPEISDREWDAAFFDLKRMEKESGFSYPGSPSTSICFRTVSKLNKVKHNHPMLSLDKTKDWDEFIKYFNSDYDVVGMVKLDGLTCNLCYENGHLISAETRGDGIEGEDIYHNILAIGSIPKSINYKDKLNIDGEIICTYQDFEQFKDKYANPRNFAAGSIRLLSAQECALRKLTFVAWNVVEGFEETNSFIDKLVKLDTLGFITVPWTSSFDWDAKEFLQEEAKRLGYPIDGLVGRYNDIAYGNSLGATEHHARAAYAFKFFDELHETKLKNIEWTMGRTGILTPVAVFDPVDDGVSTITRASLHNISVMRQLLGDIAYVNQELKIFKANEIIPQIAEAKPLEPDVLALLIPIPGVCPYCGQPTERRKENDSEVLVCGNPACEAKLINQLDHFAGIKGLNIKGLSTATIEKLIDWGWVNEPADFFELSKYRNEWIKKDGFGVKSVDNILAAIEASRHVELSSFICAIGIPLIGKTVAKDLCKIVTSYEDFRDKINSNFDFTQLDGFAENKQYYLTHFDYSKADKVREYLSLAIQKQEETSTSAAGLTFVITGSLNEYKNRAELQKVIEDLGGKVTGAVSKNTSYLINNDIESASSKNVQAKKLNIPIISEKDFKEKFLQL